MKLAEASTNLGYNVELVAMYDISKHNEICDDGFDNIYHYYAVTPGFKLKLKSIKILKLYMLFLIIYARIKNPSLVYTRTPVIAFMTGILGLDTILHCHGLNSFYNGLVFPLLFSNKRIKHVAVVSEGLRTHFKNKYKIDSPKLKVVSNGIDIKRYEYVMEKKEARLKTELPTDKNIIAYSGSLYEGRGIDLIIGLSDLMKEHYFIVIGGMPEDVSKWSVNISDNLLFLGYVPNGLIPLYLFSSDILLMPYQKNVQVYGGGFHSSEIIRPLKLFEYMAASRPIVASDLDGLREVLNEDNSLLVETDDLQKWSNAISLLINNKNLALRLSSNARHDVMNYTTDKIAKGLFNISIED